MRGHTNPRTNWEFHFFGSFTQPLNEDIRLRSYTIFPAWTFSIEKLSICIYLPLMFLPVDPKFNLCDTAVTAFKVYSHRT